LVFQLETKQCVTCNYGRTKKKCGCVGEEGSEAGVKSKGLAGPVHAYSRYRVFADVFFEETGFSLEANGFHPFKRVADFVVSVAAKGN
jgi:hypothetical protein